MGATDLGLSNGSACGGGGRGGLPGQKQTCREWKDALGKVRRRTHLAKGKIQCSYTRERREKKVQKRKKKGWPAE